MLREQESDQLSYSVKTAWNICQLFQKKAAKLTGNNFSSSHLDNNYSLLQSKTIGQQLS